MRATRDGRGLSLRRTRFASAAIGLLLAAAVIVIALPTASGGTTRQALKDVHKTRSFWHQTTLKSAFARSHAKAQLRLRTAKGVRPYALNRGALRKVLAPAPWESTSGARLHPVVISLPAPNGVFQRYALHRTAIMAPALQRKHPGIATYAGRGIDDNTATIHADISPFGFHASVRSANGGFYIDPYYRKNPNYYVSYNAQQDRSSFPFAEHEVSEANAPKAASPTAPLVPTGDVLRNYRLALITDPGYAAYVGGPSAVTAAKVALIDRVDQPYEEDLSIRMQLIGNNDLLNLNDWGAATAPNGPCGAAACFTQSQVTGCASTTRARFVIGQIIGASNYDIGHLALGQPGGGVANLGVVGRSNKAGGCTGIPTPVGDFYAIDYVAHEMGHQFSGNHPFNGNQLNCSSGNRNAATSVEPGSGSSIMAYAGICLTDDLQRHSDPYFSERSQQEISNYTSSSQAAINEVQTTSLRHFGGGNEVQQVTFGPGYQQAAAIQPLTVNIGAAPSATQLGGATEDGNTVTIATGATGATHTLQPGDVVTIAGVGVAGYNGTFTVTSVPSSRSFTYTNPISGLARSGGGTITLAVPGLTESGNTVTVHTAAAHGRSVNDIVVISGAGVAGYNGTFAVTSVPDARSFTYTDPNAGLANSGGGSATYSSPFQVRIGGNDSAVIGGTSQAYNAANVQAAIAAISGFAGTATVTGLSSTGFTVTYTGASAGLDVPNLQIVNLSCGGCFASTEETNHGGANDSFTLAYNGNVSAPIVNGTNYSAAGIVAALTPILPAGATVTIAGFGGGGVINTGFQMTFSGTLAATNINSVTVQDFSAGASGFVGETDKGGPVDNQGTTTPTGNAVPVVTAPSTVTIPLRTPFALTGSATDADGDPLTYSWEQNDRGGNAGTALLNNTKVDGPLFAMFPKSGQISDADSLLYNSPGENHLTNDPTRVFPDLQQILDNNTNADTGSCPTGPIAPPVSQANTECYAEFLPTSSYLGSAQAGNNSPVSLHMRFTARDGNGGSNFADETVVLATNAGPFLVTQPNTAIKWGTGSTQTVTWDKANTDIAPTSTANVKISLSTDGGHTYPYVLAASTPNDGSQAVALPVVATSTARIKVEAVDNVFFDVSNANFTIGDTTPPTVTAIVAPPPRPDGWNTDIVSISLQAHDEAGGSGVASVTYSTSGAQTTAPVTVPGSSAPVIVSAEGITTVSYFATDNEGNSGTPQTLVVKVDLNAPTTTATLSPSPQNGWYASPTLTLSASDGPGSGVALTQYAVDGGSFQAYSGPVSGFSTGNHVVKYRSTDNVGHVEAAKQIAFKADSDAPTANIARPKDGASFKVGQVVDANYKCSDNKNGSGLASCVGTVPVGDPIDTSTPGDHTFTVTATDKAGNVTTVTNTYNVRSVRRAVAIRMGSARFRFMRLLH
ncbi:MAG TPA: M12 family metallo-peptidase [Gaiellaceae bacterium]